MIRARMALFLARILQSSNRRPAPSGVRHAVSFCLIGAIVLDANQLTPRLDTDSADTLYSQFSVQPLATVVNPTGAPSVAWWLGNGPGGSGLAAASALSQATDVHIGLIEQGIALDHTSLTGAKIQTTSTATTGTIGLHGTQVAALMIGDLSAFGGGPGAARGATLMLAPMAMSTTIDPAAVTIALTAQHSVDVSNNSWGSGQAFADNFRSSLWAPVGNAVQSLAATGRDGLGTNLVFAAGNGRLMSNGQNIGDDANFHNLGNARQSIAVAASTSTGDVAFFSSPGANLLLAAPGHGLISAAANGGGTSVSGTSFAAPLVSGTIALMLQVNPDLGWRDVQDILAMTARAQNGAGAVTNGGTGVNGGGMVYDRDLGFGILDAEAAVRLARTWSAQSTSANEEHVFHTHAARTQADPQAAVFTFDIAAASDAFRLDTVQLTLTLTDTKLRDLKIELISPAGTVTLIAPNLAAVGTKTWLDFSFSSAATRGEDIAGTWTLRLLHAEPTPRLSVYGARLDFFGDRDDADDTFVFTKAFAGLAEEQAERRWISDTDGGHDTLNFAAAAAGMFVDLATRKGVLDGVAFDLDGTFEAAIGTAGNDTILGGTEASVLSGDDGNDLLTGKSSKDTLSGGAGNDTLNGGSGADRMTGGGGSDWFRVDHPDDQVIEAVGGGTADRVLAMVSYELAADAAIETLSTHQIGGTKAIDLTGNDFAQTIIGNDGANRLDGRGGNDLLQGKGGADTLLGGDGNDRLDGGTGADMMTGGAGNDWFYIDNSNDQVIEEANGGTADRVLAAVSYALTADASVEQLSTQKQAGREGVDLTGNDFAQTITGNAGANRLTGLGGNDALQGHEGDDTLTGGTGNDMLAGGMGADTFVFAGDFGVDRILDFDVALPGEVISLAGEGGITDFADLVANHLTDTGPSAVITLGTNMITLVGVASSSLTVDDFLF